MRRFVPLLALQGLISGALVGCGAAIATGSYLGVVLTGGSDDRPNAVPAASFREPQAGQSLNDRVQIQYDLIDGDSHQVDIQLEYSLVGGPFLAATPIADFGHDGSSDLGASPGGSPHLFVWNSSLDLGDVDQDDVRVRITPTDETGARGASVISPTFRLLNRQISTFAGGEVLGDLLIGPSGLWLDETANRLYVADDLASKTLVVDLTTLEVTRVAGNDFKGFDEDDVPATATSLDDPTVAMVLGDQLFLGTSFRVRAVRLPTGFIKTAAGTGAQGFSGDGGVPTNAEIEDQVFGLAQDSAGNLYFTDEHRVRLVNRGIAPITVGGTVVQPGTLESLGGASLLQPPEFQRLVVDTRDMLYVMSHVGIWVLNTSLAPFVVYPDGTAPVTIAPGQFGRIAGVDSGGVQGDGGLATATALRLEERGLALSADGLSYYVSTQDHRIRRIDARTGIVQTIAGNGMAVNSGDQGPASLAALHSPRGLAISASDCLFVACTSAVRALNLGGSPLSLGSLTIMPGDIATVASSSPADFLVADDCLAVGADDAVFTMDGTSNALIQIRPDTRAREVVVGGGGSFGGDGGLAVNASSAGYTLALDPAGNPVFGQEGRIRVVNRQAVDIVVAGVRIQPGFVHTIAGNGTLQASGDGGPATGSTLIGPEGITVDQTGLIYFSDEGRIRVINSGQVTVTVAGVAIPPGVVETIIGTGNAGCSGDGGPPTAAECDPIGVALDGLGNVYFADASCVGIRVVNVTGSNLLLYPNGGGGVNVAPGTIQTIAGTGAAGWNGDGLPALQTQFRDPRTLLVRSNGILLCDPGGRRVRRIDTLTGIVTTLVGTGEAGYNGDAIPLENVRVSPELTASDSVGRVYVLDGTGRVRRFLETP